jgi:hypothetical protein
LDVLKYEIIEDMKDGLKLFGAKDSTIEKYSKIIADRLERKMNPAIAQVIQLRKLLNENKEREEALSYLCDKYIEVQYADIPFVENFLR